MREALVADVGGNCHAARGRERLAAAPRSGPLLQLDAVAGEPFGVGRIVLDLAPQDVPEPLGIEGIGLD